MENMPLVNKRLPGTPSPSALYQATNGDFSSPEARRKRKYRRLSSEGSLIHITGTGTILEESLDCKQCYGGSFDAQDPGHDLEDLPPGVGQYDNFHTIDWQKDLARDRFRHRYIVKKKKESFWEMVKVYHDAWSGWLCVLLVGVAAGSVAGFIDIGEGWMKDLKEGVCPQAFWLNKEQCCWSSNETYYEGDQCDQWETWSELMKIEDSPEVSYAIAYASYVVWCLFFAALASIMVKTFAPYASGSGIPEIKTILSGFIMRGYLGKWTLVVKSVTIMLAVSAGLSLGKEGPLVHVVCCIGNVFTYLFPKYSKNEAKKREILSAAAAAGVSVAFGAPIGGVLFSLEEVSYYFPMKTLWRSFFCALVAAFILRSIDPFGTDHLVKFFMNVTRPWFIIELFPFIGLGILGGIVGTAFIRGNIAWTRWKKSSKVADYPISEVLLVTLVTALVNFPNEFTRMNGSDLIKTLFSQCGLHDSSPLCDYTRNMTSTSRHMYIIGTGPGVYHSLYLLAVALGCKLIITIFTYGIKLPAGLFIPSMAMGAIMGRMVGVGMQQLALTYKGSWPFHTTCGVNEDCMSPGLYAMIGAAACLAGVTRMTVSLVVIMFELTGSVDYIVPLMATVVASKWVGDAMDREGIYDAHIHLNKYPYLDNKTEFSNPSMAEDLTRSIRRTRGSLCYLFQDGMTLEETEQILQKTSHNGFPVIVSRDNPYLVGFVLRRDVSLALAHIKKNRDDINARSIVCFQRHRSLSGSVESKINLNKIIDLAPTTVTIQTPMETVIDMFCKLGLRQTLVTNNGTLVDIITKKDILNYIQELKSNTKESTENDEKIGK